MKNSRIGSTKICGDLANLSEIATGITWIFSALQPVNRQISSFIAWEMVVTLVDHAIGQSSHNFLRIQRDMPVRRLRNPQSKTVMSAFFRAAPSTAKLISPVTWVMAL